MVSLSGRWLLLWCVCTGATEQKVFLSRRRWFWFVDFFFAWSYWKKRTRSGEMMIGTVGETRRRWESSSVVRDWGCFGRSKTDNFESSSFVFARVALCLQFTLNACGRACVCCSGWHRGRRCRTVMSVRILNGGHKGCVLLCALNEIYGYFCSWLSIARRRSLCWELDCIVHIHNFLSVILRVCQSEWAFSSSDSEMWTCFHC